MLPWCAGLLPQTVETARALEALHPLAGGLRAGQQQQLTGALLLRGGHQRLWPQSWLELAWWLSASQLAGILPIAVGEILRRLTGKCLMSVVREDARSYFWPVQVGVGVAKGAEKAVHCVRAWVHRNSAASDKVLLKIDFSNAFCCVSREVALSQAREHFPALARWSRWCYREPSHLQFGEHVLASSSGVRQGDPLGPLLFAGAILPLARELKASPLELAVQFLDMMGSLQGTCPRSVLRCFREDMLRQLYRTPPQ